MTQHKSLFEGHPASLPPSLHRGITVRDPMEILDRISFEARKVPQGARLLERMVRDRRCDMAWTCRGWNSRRYGRHFGFPHGSGFVDVIRSTGAQVCHDPHSPFGLSGCTFGESVTWGKYRGAEEDKLVQTRSDYSVLFPLPGAYALEACDNRPPVDLVPDMHSMTKRLEDAL